MKILHTADWHLGDRLGRIDRTDDLSRAVERVAAYCQQEKVDVLLVAGDLFSELARPDSLRDAIRHLQEVFVPFLHDGGTILALTGNHDNENFCQTLRAAMNLAAPVADRVAERVPPGRLYLTIGPTLLRLAERSGNGEVQFLLMPYPTPSRYLRNEPAQRYGSLEERNRHLQAAYRRTLHELQADPGYQEALPTVLSAHIHVRGGQVNPLFRISEAEDVVFERADLSDAFAYIALGHIHKPQCVGGLTHARYSGSIERMDLGESTDHKQVVLVDIGPEGRRAEPVWLPLDATPIYEVAIHQPREELPQLRDRYPDHERALVHIQLRYTAGQDNLEEVLRELDAIFPRWYSRSWEEASTLGPALTIGEAARSQSFEESVRDYLDTELINHPDDVRNAVLARAEDLMREMPT